MIQYGLISQTDARTIEKTFDLIFKEVDDEYLHITEIGVYNGQTSRGIREYVFQNKRGICYTAIDNEKDKPIKKPFPECNLIIGNSNEVYHKLEDNSQHFMFVDGCHCFSHVISDYYCYRRKVKIGGYLAFHDTGSHIKPFKDFQHGDKDNPDAFISVRKALMELNLFGKFQTIWELVFDEADENNEAGGICVFKRIM